MSSSSGFLTFIRDSLQEFAQNLLERIPENKRRVVLLLITASVALLLFAMILLLKTSDNRDRGETADVGVQWQLTPINDFFLPEEPDFIPGVLLEREQRTNWTKDDARVYWRDPLQYGEEIWRGRVDTVIDEFLEHIP